MQKDSEKDRGNTRFPTILQNEAQVQPRHGAHASDR